MVEQLTLAQLKLAPLGLAAPFALEGPGGQQLLCDAIFRHLPGKRLVLRAHLGGRSVLVKLFFRQRDFVCERAGLAAMRAAGIACPGEVWTLTDEGPPSGFLLATEFLDNAASLQDCYRQWQPEELVELLRRAVALTGRLHRRGRMQADIHLDNFLFRDNQLYMIDGGGIAPLKKPLENLALLFAQMTPDYDRLSAMTLDAYGENPPDGQRLQALIATMREKRIRHYLAKTTRNCTQFMVPKTAGAFVAVARNAASEQLLKLMDRPEAATGQAAFLKQGNSATVMKVAGNEVSWVLKRYNIKSFWHGLSRCFRPSRAWISWKSAHRLELLGIATPTPLAVREERVGPLRRQAYLLTECVDGDNLQAWLLKRGQGGVPEWLDREVVRLFDNLWRGRTSHGDMKATNLIVADRHLEVIDLDAVRHHRCKQGFVRSYRKDLQRFMDNWQGETWQHFEELLRPMATRSGISLVNKKV
ncbi:lipopolysaccharide kinase InaA family protein [Porticoccus sp.]